MSVIACKMEPQTDEDLFKLIIQGKKRKKNKIKIWFNSLNFWISDESQKDFDDDNIFDEDDDDSVKDPDYKENENEDRDEEDDEDHDENDANKANKANNKQKSMPLNDLHFVQIIKSVGKCLLEKSQTPAMKNKKKAALTLVVSECLSKHGIQLTEQQAKRKLENLKMRAKAKTDAKKTGNKPIILNSADKLLLTLLNAEENPSITQLPCK